MARSRPSAGSGAALRRAAGAFGVAVAAVVMAGCGHPATVAECEEIVERIARLELERRHRNDSEGVAQEIEDTKQALRESTMKDCVGKRITTRAMTCVRAAKTSKEIVEDCFD